MTKPLVCSSDLASAGATLPVLFAAVWLAANSIRVPNSDATIGIATLTEILTKILLLEVETRSWMIPDKPRVMANRTWHGSQVLARFSGCFRSGRYRKSKETRTDTRRPLGEEADLIDAEVNDPSTPAISLG